MENESDATENNAGQNSNQYELFQPFAMPRHKLDADQYSAEDLDGVTESLFGSGNLNYLTLQSGISDAMFKLSDGGLVNETHDFHEIEGSTNTASESFPDLSGFSGTSLGQGYEVAGYVPQTNGYNGSLNTAALSDLAVNSSSQNPVSAFGFNASGTGTNAFNGVSLNENTARTGSDGRDGDDGTDGSNGGGDCCSCDGPIINIEGPLIDIDLDSVTENAFTLLSQTIDNVFNLIEGIEIVEILNVISDLTISILNEVTNLLDTELDFGTLLTLDLDATVGEITDIDLDIETVNGLVTGFEKVIDLTDVTDALDNIIQLGGFDPLSIQAHLDLLNPQEAGEGDTDLTLLADLGFAGADIPVIDQEVSLDSIENLVGDIDLDITIDETLDILNTGDGQDTDILLENGLIDDTDLNLVMDPVEDLVGDVDVAGSLDTNLLNSDSTENDTGDHDLVLNSDIDLVDENLGNLDLDVELDAVETITGDVDVDLSAALDVLGDAADPLVDEYDGGGADDGLLSYAGDLTADIVEELTHDSDIELDLEAAVSLLDDASDLSSSEDYDAIESWTETPLVDSDNIFGYGAGDDSGLNSFMPDASANVAEGLGGLDINSDSDGLLSGGLFG